MAEMVTERRKPGGVNLKRSKSVRASLKSIGAKLLNNNSSPVRRELLNKTPSMTSLQEFYRPENTKPFRLHRPTSIETILKTPMINLDKNAAVGKPFKIVEKLNKNKRDLLDGHQVKISTPPEVVAPKAAQLLQIPSGVWDSNDFKQPLKRIYSEKCVQHGKFSEFNYDYRNNGFQRNQLRLSITGRRRKRTTNSNSSHSDDESKRKYDLDFNWEICICWKIPRIICYLWFV